MEIRHRDFFGNGCSTEALEALSTLDPADLVPELLSDANIVILALGNMQDFILPEAERRLASKIVGKEARIWFRILGIVSGDAVVKGIAEFVRVSTESNAIIIGHGNQSEMPAQSSERFSGILKRGEVKEVAMEFITRGAVVRQSNFFRSVEINAAHDLTCATWKFLSCFQIGLENLIISQRLRSLSACGTETVQNTFFEVDTGSDNIKSQNFKVLESHEDFLSRSEQKRIVWLVWDTWDKSINTNYNHLWGYIL